VIIDYDFKLGGNRLRGSGWRGLAALGVVLALRAGIVGVITLSARPAGAVLVQLLQRLLGA
jgi:hypothetical protein